MVPEKIVIALGGNALQSGKGEATAEAQLEVVKNTCSHIAKISDMFTVEEYIYFTSCLFKSESERTAYNKIGCSSTGLVAIKNSCIIKVGIGLKIAVRKGEKLDAKNEELFKQFINS